MLQPEDEDRVRELAAIVRAQAARLCRLGRRGKVVLTVKIEVHPHPHISRDSNVILVEEYPLVASLTTPKGGATL